MFIFHFMKKNFVKFRKKMIEKRMKNEISEAREFQIL